MTSLTGISRAMVGVCQKTNPSSGGAGTLPGGWAGDGDVLAVNGISVSVGISVQRTSGNEELADVG